jgi:hypothetical protein
MDDVHEPDYTLEPLDDAPAANPFALAPLEPPARTIGWRHLPPERWTPERIHPAPYNAKIRRLPPAKLLRLRRGLLEFGWAGTFIVRAEDGMLIGGAQRYALALEAIRDRGRDLPEMVRLNLADPHDGRGPTLAVSPVLGIPDAKALALNILLNNREAQGEFAPMGLAEAFAELDGHGFDVTDTGYDLEQVAALVTWEADDTKNGGAKAAGAEPATDSRKNVKRAPALPCTRADVERVRRWYGVADDEGMTDAGALAAVERLERLLELPDEAFAASTEGANLPHTPDGPGLDFGTPEPAGGTPSADVTPTPPGVPRGTPAPIPTTAGAKQWQRKS